MPLKRHAQSVTWNSNTETVRFFMATEGGDLEMCAVSKEALSDLTEASAMDGPKCLEAFEAHRDRIEAVASLKWDRGDRHPEGYTLITTDDLSP